LILAFLKSIAMQTRSSSSTLLIALLVLITFPLWIGLLAGAIGIVAGIFGAFIGIVAGIFGGLAGIIGGIFGWIFDFDSWDHDNHWFPFWNFKMIVIAMVVLVVLLATRSHRAKR
jgi:hypothetical protein